MQGFTRRVASLDSITRVKNVWRFSFQSTAERHNHFLTLGKGAVSITPAIPFQVNANTPRVSVEGWSQGAVLQIGKGRVAVFAEGMMFSSQLDTKTGKKYGLTSMGGEQNEMFLLNVMHWLSGTILDVMVKSYATKYILLFTIYSNYIINHCSMEHQSVDISLKSYNTITTLFFCFVKCLVSLVHRIPIRV